ncbi:MAG: CPBP family intramembrane metalloprotease [Bacteroidota bacterium]|nr:CPBP family intramembrane metalloprotease [Bacteroidota bacterium]
MKTKTIILGLCTLIFFGLGGFLIIEYYLLIDFIEILRRGWAIPLQILIGIIYGMASSLICLFIINREFFKNEKEFYSRKISYFHLNNVNIVLLSLCAGIGEEIFFRAALQPIIGIWLTAIVFVVLHGYVNPWNWRISIYGLVMILIMVGIGFLYEIAGLIAVIVAHTVIDIVLFKNLMNNKDIGEAI